MSRLRESIERIKHILEDSGYSVALNESGSNGIIGSTTMILNNCSLKGKFKKDCLLLECDERHLKLVFKNRCKYNGNMIY